MNLIIFFNGWGMDSSIFHTTQELCALNHEINHKINYKIICVNYPYKLPEINFEEYDKVFFVGWSFGVYYLNKFINESCSHSNNYSNDNHSYEFEKYRILAINGTPEILGNMGIPEKMMRLTMDNLTSESLVKFYENMGYCGNIANHNKDISTLKDELGDLIGNYKVYDNRIQGAFIGENDRIISGKNQKKFYTSKNIPFQVADVGHIPFNSIATFIEIVENLSSLLNSDSKN